MAKLHCCLAGFDDEVALQIEGMAGLLHAYLTAEWSFGDAESGRCDLLLCDIGSARGAAAWQEGKALGRICAAATGPGVPAGGLVLLKPLRLHGPGGLVQVLNEAEQVGATPAMESIMASTPAAPPVPPRRTPSPGPRKTGRLWSVLRAIASWFAARPPHPASRAAPAQPAHSLAKDAWAYAMADADIPAAPVREAAPAPAPVPRHVPGQALVATGRDLARMPEAPRPEQARGQAPEQALRVRRPSPVATGHAVVLDAMGCDLLALLRRAKAASQVIVVRLVGIPGICVDPQMESAYTFATLQAVFDGADAAVPPDRVVVASNSYYGRMELNPTYQGRLVSVPDVPLKHLLWVAVLRCGGAEEAARFRDGAFRMVGWPDFSTLPHVRHHVAWSGLLKRRPTTAAALAKAAGTGTDEAALFLAACDELGVLDRKELTPALAGAGGRRAGRGVMGPLALGQPGAA